METEGGVCDLSLNLGLRRNLLRPHLVLILDTYYLILK